ncbi:MAG TPA: hypothetical protein VJN70_14740 [Gemmatimonadaceae bacterium]|nr:hypothetical protein [Gemmatimonadaceae bacterium]
MKFLVGIVGMGTNPHVGCFLDFAKALANALRALGHEVEYATAEARRLRPGRLIMLGANNLSDPGGHIPDGSIVFNSEQLAAVDNPAFFLQNYLQYRRLTVWDYSEANLAALKKLGITRAVHCPVGYVPSMTTIEPETEDIDILFYGSVAGPRREILDALDQTGLNIVRLFGVYGEDRDAFIARSKLVLNLHYYPNGVFEIFRVSHLLANRKCVLTEAGGCDRALEDFARLACAYVPREQIVDTAKMLAANEKMRHEQARVGQEAFKKLDFVQGVGEALEQS